ncbi:hypothetical protein RZS08_60305, partial [Arthrospira platensis SPKY1]|nr:hypothetical protein [Arthrospira platensis SPKY1]
RSIRRGLARASGRIFVVEHVAKLAYNRLDVSQVGGAADCVGRKRRGDQHRHQREDRFHGGRAGRGRSETGQHQHRPERTRLACRVHARVAVRQSQHPYRAQK